MPYALERADFADAANRQYQKPKSTWTTGKSIKSFEQIKDIPNSFLAVDNTEIGYKNRIPLYLFGFLY